jgi:flagellar protein FliO/FliZ
MRVALKIAAFAAACGASAHAFAQQAATGAVTGQLVSLVVGMAAVLGVIAGAAWILKRVAPRTYGSASVLRVVAGTAVGQRERVVVVEVGSTWLVLGVAPGSVNALHQMPSVALDAQPVASTVANTQFAHWLKKFMEKRGER